MVVDLDATIGRLSIGAPIRTLSTLGPAELLALGDRPVGRWMIDQKWARPLSEEELRAAIVDAYGSLSRRGLLRVVESGGERPVLAAVDECAIVVGMRAEPDTVTIVGQDGVDDPLMMVSHCRLVDGIDWCLVELRPTAGRSEFTLCADEIAAAVLAHCLTDRLDGGTRRLEMVDADLATLLELSVAGDPDSSVVVRDGSGSRVDIGQLEGLIQRQWRTPISPQGS